MGFREVSGARVYRNWRDDWSEGEYIIGTFLANGEQDGKYGIQQWYDIQVEESNFGHDNSKVLRLNGNGSLDNKMEGMDVNTKVKIQYDGHKILTTGAFKGKEFADVKVFVADNEGPEADKTVDTETENPVDYSGL